MTIGNIFNMVAKLQAKGMSIAEIKAIPIYIGNDEELNGIHTAWAIEYIGEKRERDEDQEYILDLISEDCCNEPFKKNCIVIE